MNSICAEISSSPCKCIRQSDDSSHGNDTVKMNREKNSSDDKSLWKCTRQIHEAIRHSNIVKFTYLIKTVKFGKIDILDVDRRTPLMVACMTKYKSKRAEKCILESILSLQPQINMIDNHGRTALIYACMVNNSYFVERILSELLYDIDINIQDCNGMTAIMYATENDNHAIVKRLLKPYLKFKLSLSAKRHSGETVLDIAFKRGCSKVVQELYDAGCCRMHYSTDVQHRPLSNPLKKLPDRSKPGIVRSKTAEGIRPKRGHLYQWRGKTPTPTTATSESSTKMSKQNETLHHIFNLYAQQFAPSFKNSAKLPDPAPPERPSIEIDSDSDDSLLSMRSFMSHSNHREPRRSHAGLESYFKGLHVSPHMKTTRQRKTGMAALTVSRPLIRKISAPCFSNNSLSFNVPKQREINPAGILKFR